MSEDRVKNDPDYRAKTLRTQDGDDPDKVVEQAVAFLGQKIDNAFIKRDAYKNLDGALRKLDRGSELNDLTAKKALKGKK